ncbi:hypothetical protein SLS54_006976 [Diplodia seriata]
MSNHTRSLEVSQTAEGDDDMSNLLSLIEPTRVKNPKDLREQLREASSVFRKLNSKQQQRKIGKVWKIIKKTSGSHHDDRPSASILVEEGHDDRQSASILVEEGHDGVIVTTLDNRSDEEIWKELALQIGKELQDLPHVSRMKGFCDIRFKRTDENIQFTWADLHSWDHPIPFVGFTGHTPLSHEHLSTMLHSQSVRHHGIVSPDQFHSPLRLHHFMSERAYTAPLEEMMEPCLSGTERIIDVNRRLYASISVPFEIYFGPRKDLATVLPRAQETRQCVGFICQALLKSTDAIKSITPLIISTRDPREWYVALIVSKTGDHRLLPIAPVLVGMNDIQTQRFFRSNLRRMSGWYTKSPDYHDDDDVLSKFRNHPTLACYNVDCIAPLDDPLNHSGASTAVFSPIWHLSYDIRGAILEAGYDPATHYVFSWYSKTDINYFACLLSGVDTWLGEGFPQVDRTQEQQYWPDKLQPINLGPMVKRVVSLPAYTLSTVYNHLVSNGTQGKFHTAEYDTYALVAIAKYLAMK